MRRHLRAAIGAGGIVAVVAIAACAPPPGSPAPMTRVVTRPPHLYAERPIDSWGQNGIAYSVEIQGNTVYVGGDFSRAVKGKQSVPRSNVMAVNRDTGELFPGFVADTNGNVYS